MLLEVKELNTYYGDSHALQNMSLEVKDGEIVALLGRNGMGKTTTMKSIMGLLKPRSGKVIFQGKDVTGFAPYKVARAGIGFMPHVLHESLVADCHRAQFGVLSSASSMHFIAMYGSLRPGHDVFNRF